MALMTDVLPDPERPNSAVTDRADVVFPVAPVAVALRSLVTSVAKLDPVEFRIRNALADGSTPEVS